MRRARSALLALSAGAAAVLTPTAGATSVTSTIALPLIQTISADAALGVSAPLPMNPVSSSGSEGFGLTLTQVGATVIERVDSRPLHWGADLFEGNRAIAPRPDPVRLRVRYRVDLGAGAPRPLTDFTLWRDGVRLPGYEFEISQQFGLNLLAVELRPRDHKPSLRFTAVTFVRPPAPAQIQSMGPAGAVALLGFGSVVAALLSFGMRRRRRAWRRSARAEFIRGGKRFDLELPGDKLLGLDCTAHALLYADQRGASFSIPVDCVVAVDIDESPRYPLDAILNIDLEGFRIHSLQVRCSRPEAIFFAARLRPYCPLRAMDPPLPMRVKMMPT